MASTLQGEPCTCACGNHGVIVERDKWTPTFIVEHEGGEFHLIHTVEVKHDEHGVAYRFKMGAA